MARRIGIIYCKRIQDSSCVGCAKCYKAISERSFAFEGDEPVELVFKTSCGDCPGLVLPRLDLQATVLDALETPMRSLDAIYLATCVKKATAVMGCPMRLEAVTAKIEEIYGVPVHLGTHDY
jgi:predicted metal-binding protein